MRHRYSFCNQVTDAVILHASPPIATAWCRRENLSSGVGTGALAPLTHNHQGAADCLEQRFDFGFDVLYAVARPEHRTDIFVGSKLGDLRWRKPR